MTTTIPFPYPMPMPMPMMGGDFGNSFLSPMDGGIPSIPFFPGFTPKGVGGPIFPEKYKNLTHKKHHKSRMNDDDEIPFPFRHKQKMPNEAFLLDQKFSMPVPLVSHQRLAKELNFDYDTLLGYLTNNSSPNYAPAPIQSDYVPAVSASYGQPIPILPTAQPYAQPIPNQPYKPDLTPIAPIAK
jgi:hypothetical protein